MAMKAEEGLLAVEYVMNGKIDEMKVLALIAGTVEGVGIDTFSRVLVDYCTKIATEEQHMKVLAALAFDQGVFDGE